MQKWECCELHHLLSLPGLTFFVEEGKCTFFYLQEKKAESTSWKLSDNAPKKAGTRFLRDLADIQGKDESELRAKTIARLGVVGWEAVGNVAHARSARPEILFKRPLEE